MIVRNLRLLVTVLQSVPNPPKSPVSLPVVQWFWGKGKPPHPLAPEGVHPNRHRHDHEKEGREHGRRVTKEV